MFHRWSLQSATTKTLQISHEFINISDLFQLILRELFLILGGTQTHDYSIDSDLAVHLINFVTEMKIRSSGIVQYCVLSNKYIHTYIHVVLVNICISSPRALWLDLTHFTWKPLTPLCRLFDPEMSSRIPGKSDHSRHRARQSFLQPRIFAVRNARAEQTPCAVWVCGSKAENQLFGSPRFNVPYLRQQKRYHLNQ